MEGIDKFQGHRFKKDALLRSLIFEREMKSMKPAPDPLAESYYGSSVYEQLKAPIWSNIRYVMEPFRRSASL